MKKRVIQNLLEGSKVLWVVWTIFKERKWNEDDQAGNCTELVGIWWRVIRLKESVKVKMAVLNEQPGRMNNQKQSERAFLKILNAARSRISHWHYIWLLKVNLLSKIKPKFDISSPNLTKQHCKKKKKKLVEGR